MSKLKKKKKKKKKKKTMLPYFGDLVAGWSRSHVLVASPHKDFSRLTGGSMSQSRKILGIFFKIFFFNVSHNSVWRLVRRWKVQSRGDSEIFAAYLATLSWVELPVVKNTWINFSKFLS